MYYFHLNLLLFRFKYTLMCHNSSGFFLIVIVKSVYPFKLKKTIRSVSIILKSYLGLFLIKTDKYFII